MYNLFDSFTEKERSALVGVEIMVKIQRAIVKLRNTFSTFKALIVSRRSQSECYFAKID